MRSPAVAQFAREHAHEVTRHAFYQFLADRSLGQAQAAARAAGMPIGLIADLAVGVDAGGSQCWSRPDETLIGLSIGAPPDLLSPRGQSWGLVAFSPRGLQLNGFSGYIDMLRAAMRHAGGVRIDHAMGLARLWVLPDGASAAEGVYLHFPLDDMLRLIRLESLRHQAIVLAEDLGTVPEGFQDKIGDAGMLGMRVLWFERAHDLGFTAPTGWTRGAVAMTSTHDLATVAGWWSGRDIDLARAGRHARRRRTGRARARPLDAVGHHARQRRRRRRAARPRRHCGSRRRRLAPRGGVGVRPRHAADRGRARTDRAAEPARDPGRASQLAPPAAGSGARRCWTPRS